MKKPVGAGSPHGSDVASSLVGCPSCAELSAFQRLARAAGYPCSLKNFPCLESTCRQIGYKDDSPEPDQRDQGVGGYRAKCHRAKYHRFDHVYVHLLVP